MSWVSEVRRKPDGRHTFNPDSPVKPSLRIGDLNKDDDRHCAELTRPCG